MKRRQPAGKRTLMLACGAGYFTVAVVAVAGAQLGIYGAATRVVWIGLGAWCVLLHAAIVIAASRISTDWWWRAMSISFVALGLVLALNSALRVDGTSEQRSATLAWSTVAVVLGWFAMHAFRPAFNRALLRDHLLERSELARDGSSVLGERGWMLFSQYGRVMSGPRQGLYVSGIPTAEARALLAQLTSGGRIPIHLMHRHRSGHYESSWLRLRDGGLVMEFPEREELA